MIDNRQLIIPEPRNFEFEEIVVERGREQKRRQQKREIPWDVNRILTTQY